MVASLLRLVAIAESYSLWFDQYFAVAHLQIIDFGVVLGLCVLIDWLGCLA